MASMRWTNEWLNGNDAHKEYLFLMEKKLVKTERVVKSSTKKAKRVVAVV